MTVAVRSRFEVFKRDGFTCGYCGRTPDDGVKLEVDHITPRAGGGGDEITNLVTSCWDCNRGKGARSLDNKAPSLTQGLINTRERALQLDEYRKWQDELDDVSNTLLTRVWQEWIDSFGGRNEPTPEGHIRWYSDLVGMPKKASLFRQFDKLEVSQIIHAIHGTHRKWSAGGLYDSEVQRYFFGTLKRMAEDDKPVTPCDQATLDRWFDGGEGFGRDAERSHIGQILRNYQEHGYETLASAVIALFPDAD